MEEREIRRGDIYHANLNPVVGSEQGGYRPISANLMKNYTKSEYCRRFIK